MPFVRLLSTMGTLGLFSGILIGCQRGPQTAAELGQAWGENDCKMKELKDDSFSGNLSSEEAKEAYEEMEYLARVSAGYQKLYHHAPSERNWSQSDIFNSRKSTRRRLCGISY